MHIARILQTWKAFLKLVQLDIAIKITNLAKQIHDGPQPSRNCWLLITFLFEIQINFG